jgi:RimJ/RimL family protein N-acetyltransferase
MTVEVAARSFHKEAVGYGFTLTDFVHFASTLLGIAMARNEGAAVGDAPQPPAERHASLPVVGPRLTLRAFGAPGDRERLDRWVADADGRFFLLSTASGRSLDVDHLLRDPTNRVGVMVSGDRPIGCMAYIDHHPDQGRAELRKIIGERDMRGHGLAREATKLWLGYGLGGLGLKKIYLTTLMTHIRNIQLNEALGFQVEGILRREVLIDGELRDVLRMGLWVE